MSTDLLSPVCRHGHEQPYCATCEYYEALAENGLTLHYGSGHMISLWRGDEPLYDCVLRDCNDEGMVHAVVMAFVCGLGAGA